MLDREQDVFTAELLSKISKSDIHRVFLSITELAAEKLIESHEIVKYIPYSEPYNTTEKRVDFLIVNLGFGRVPFRIVETCFEMKRLAKIDPIVCVISLLDKNRRGYTKPLELVEGDILRRVRSYRYHEKRV